MNNIATHTQPVNGYRANFIIRADLSRHGLTNRFEQLWAFKTAESTFEICCIPFFTYGISLGDIVLCDSDYFFQRVVEKRGHKTLRIAVSSINIQSQLHERIHCWLESTKLTYEWFAPGYVAIDVPGSDFLNIDTSQIDELRSQRLITIELDE